MESSTPNAASSIVDVLLLDTHAVLWIDGGFRISDAASAAIEPARLSGGVLVSPVSAWEIGTLVRKGRLQLDVTPAAWLQRFLEQPGVRLTPLTVEAAANSASLPEPFHSDPADRLLVATARELGVPIVTRDAAILAYAATGAVRAIPC